MLDEITKDDLRKMSKSARRNASKKAGVQEKMRTRVERNKKAYTRKVKHNRTPEDIEFSEFLDILDELGDEFDEHDIYMGY